jgi:hypothetical protein
MSDAHPGARVRGSQGVVVVLAMLAVLSAGCHRTRPLAEVGLVSTERVRLMANEGIRFVPMDSAGLMAADACRARHLTARVMESRRDTLVLGEVNVIDMDRGSVTCRRTVSAAVVVSEQRSLRIGVIEATPRRAFVAGFLAGPVAIMLYITIGLMIAGEY